MPKVTEQHRELRRSEIIDACAKVYSERGFQDITIKEISELTAFSRASIYTYFETRDEILLALLCREYDAWIADLKTLAAVRTQLTSHQIAEEIARTLESREILLRIQNMNLHEIEVNSRIEYLADFKRRYRSALEALDGILAAQFPVMSSEERTVACRSFSAYLFGVYPFCFHTEKQKEAMAMIGMQPTDASIFSMIYEYVMLIIPERTETR